MDKAHFELNCKNKRSLIISMKVKFRPNLNIPPYAPK